MGRKRKRESSDERMRRKIREYEDRLAKKRRHRDRDSACSDSDAHSNEYNDVTELRSNGHTASPTYYDWEDAGETGAVYSPRELPPIDLTDDYSGHTQAIASVVVAATAAPTAVVAASSATAAATPAPANSGLTQVQLPRPSGQTGVAAVQVAASAPSATSALPPAADLETAQAQSASTPAADAVTASTTAAATEDPVLNDVILALLGDAPRTDVALGPAVHKDISLRWLEILSKGFKDEATKTKIIGEHAIPCNLESLVPPILNAEVISALATTPSIIKRDYALQQRQKQMGIVLAALSKTLNFLVYDSSLTTPESVLKPLSDASRLLCELFYSETRTRRGFIISAVNSQMKDQLIESTPSKFLFGENLADRLKTAQNIHRSANILQPNQNRPNFPRNFNNYLNTRTPYRRPAAAAAAGRPEAGRQQPSARAHPPPPHHPPPPPPGARAGAYRAQPQGRRRSPPPPPRRRPPPPPSHRRRY